MSENQKQHWRDELELFYVPKDISVDWVNLEFNKGYEKYDRDGLIFTGPKVSTEATPLEGYFGNSYKCIRGALDSLSFTLPEPVRSKDEVNLTYLVSNDGDLITDNISNPLFYKVKVSSFQDVDRVKKLHDLNSSARIRIDCNGAFNVEDSLKIIELLKDVDIEFIEQPCKTNSENAQLRKKTDVLIALDESANSREDIDEIQHLEAGDIIVVKVQPAGGIFSALDIVGQWGKDVVIGSMMESTIGLDLGMKLALSIPSLNYACGLSSSNIGNIIREPLY